MHGRSTCPECGTILRIRDRSFVGRKVNCPECKAKLRIEATEHDEEFVFRRMTTEELVALEKKNPSTKTQRGKSSPAPPEPKRLWVTRFINSPLTATWLVLIAISSLFAVLALKPKFRFAANPTSSNTTAAQNGEPAPSATDHADNSVIDVPLVTIAKGAAEPVAIAEPAISALEPANTDGPLAWSPIIEIKDEVPEDVPVNTPPPKIDVEAKLAQKIRLYKQPRVSRKVLIDALQEQIGVPILYDVDELGHDSLDDKVAFELENTTLGNVIQSVSDAAGWQVQIEDTGLRLTLKEPTRPF